MSTQVRTSDQSRASTKIVIGFLLLCAVAYGAKEAYESSKLSKIVLTPIKPTTVNLVGVDTAKGGYHIVVANRIAQLVQSDMGAFEGSNQDQSGQGGSGGGDDSDAEKKKIPLKEMIETLQGKSSSIGSFVSVLNDMKPEDIEPKAVDWSQADIEKALAGDATLKTKLQQDLNTNLDGTPLPEFRPSTFQTGITIHIPVTMTVSGPSGDEKLVGDLPYPFQSRLMQALEDRVKAEANLTDRTLIGYYAEVAKPVLDDPKNRQNVAQALQQILSTNHMNGMTELPQTVLGSIQILANDQMIKSASYSTVDTTKGPVYNMDLELTDEGRDRLWKYSHDKVGTQLLLVVDGVAVAAIRINDVLAQTHLTIENLPDEMIVKDAVNKINSVGKANK